MNPQDAQARGLQDHDLAWVYNDVGGFKIHVKASAAVQPGEVIVYHAWEPYQFADWMGSQAVVASPWKPLHLLGDYGHLTWRTILGQPSHIMRAMAVEVEKARPA
jgi:anaerobic selenocysteine-containing dehydrogenase